MSFACYAKPHMATTPHRSWTAPYAALDFKGSRLELGIPATPNNAAVQSGKSPRQKGPRRGEWGQPEQPAEVGYLIGVQGQWGSTPKVLHHHNRVVRSRNFNATYDSVS